MCHDRNVRGMVGLKKMLRVKLDIRPNVGGIYVSFPYYHVKVVCLSFLIYELIT